VVESRDVTDDNDDWMRRRLLGAGAAVAPLLSTGCLRLTGGDATTTTDSARTGGRTTTAAETATDADTATNAESATDAPADTDTATEGGDGTEQETDAETTTGSDGTLSGLEPVFRHPLDGSFEDAANDVDGQPTDGGLAFVDGDRGTALAFDGRGTRSAAGYYDLPYDALERHLDVGDPITAAFWMRPAALDDWYATFVGTGVTVSLRGGNLRISRFNTQTRGNDYEASVSAARVLTAGRYQHVIATVDPGAAARLFVDGTEVAATGVDPDQGYQPKAPRSITAARVGFVPSGDDGGYDAHYEGHLDDLRFYRGSVDADGARTLYDEMR
jgi:hypothetical protein